MRVRPINGITQEYDEPDVGDHLCNSLGSWWIEEIVRAGLAGEEMFLAYPFSIVLLERGGKLRSIPVKPLFKVVIEEMYFFHQGPRNTRMLGQIVIERSCTSSLCANNDKVG